MSTPAAAARGSAALTMPVPSEVEGLGTAAGAEWIGLMHPPKASAAARRM
jgi:hypothetical protein